MINNWPLSVINYKLNFTLWALRLILPAKTPHKTVEIKGVFVVAFIFAKKLKSKPSLAMAYKIRGNGKSAPKRLKIILCTMDQLKETIGLR